MVKKAQPEENLEQTDKTDEKHIFICVVKVIHDGKTYKNDEELEMTEQEAKPLLESRAIKALPAKKEDEAE